jgi:protection-of-telomeres protein 1
MRARFFAKKESDLPSVRAVGEILLLSGIQISVFHNETLLQSSSEDSGMLKWLLLRRPNTHPQTLCRPPVFGQQLTRENHAAMARLRDWYVVTGGNAVGAASSTPQSVTAAAAVVPKRTEGRQFALVKDMKSGHFYDMVGKVVKTFNDHLCVTVYVTDYTENKDLYKYDPQTIDFSSERAWKGPWGRYTLQVTLWDAHAVAARYKVAEGQYLFLRNMRIKLNKDQLYEGVLNGDKKFPDRVDFAVIGNMGDSGVKAIEQREKEYNRRIANEGREKEYNRRTANEGRKREDGEEAEYGGVDDAVPPRNGNESEIQHILGDENDMVKCERPSMTFTSIREILERRMPKGRTYDNRKYHIVAKVIDFLPKKMKDFAKPVPVDESNSDNANDHRNTEPAEWEWRFALLVEGRDGHQIQVIVSGKEAEYLLNLDAGELVPTYQSRAHFQRPGC